MTAWTSDGTRVDGIGVPAAERVYFPVLAVSLVALNAATFMYHLSDATIFNIIAIAVSVALIGLSLHVVLRSPGGADRIFLVSACVAVCLSMLCNLASTSFVEALKYLSIYFFYAAGRSCSGPQRPVEIRCLYALAALPILFLASAQSKVYSQEYAFAYLPNANTAVLYFSAILFALTRRHGNVIIMLQLVNAALMNKVGAVVATAVAIGLWAVFPLRKQSVFAVVFLVLGAGVTYLAGGLDRVITAYENVALIFSLQPSTVAGMSYKDLVQLTGTTDLSAFFRVIHWSNIWDLYTNGGLTTLLFGYGAGQTTPLTYAGLSPHNDYLRILAEYGPLNLLVFVGFLFYIVVALQHAAARVLFIVLMIYFFSENLIDNFTSIALYFAYAGRLTADNRLLPARSPRRPRRERRSAAAGQAGPAEA